MSLSVQPPPGGASGSYADVKTVIASGNLAGRRVCVFAAASGDCKVQPYVRYHLDALKNAGLSVVLILSADRIPNANIRRQAENCDAFMVRKGLATNFESWRDALRLAPSLWLAESVLFVDDSVFGPGPRPEAASSARICRHGGFYRHDGNLRRPPPLSQPLSSAEEAGPSTIPDCANSGRRGGWPAPVSAAVLKPRLSCCRPASMPV